MDDAQQKLWSLVDDNPTCMMVTLDQTPSMDARPMNVAARPDDRSLLFYTRLLVGKSHDVAETGQVCLCFSSPKKGDFVTVVGTAELETDKALLRKHWSPFVDAWFPEGPDGDDVAMIRVTATKARYWDSESSQVLAALKMLKASAAGKQPDLGEQRDVNFRQKDKAHSFYEA